jgi:hypothetical protein
MAILRKNAHLSVYVLKFHYFPLLLEEIPKLLDLILEFYVVFSYLI